jgi:hypothetical protein
MANTKHYILTSVTLGAIAAASALLISASNMVTKDKIAQNEIDSINSGIAKIFGESAKILNEGKVEDSSYKYVSYYYEVKSNEDAGYVIRTTGSNMYGKISLIIGFNYDEEFKSLSVITNEQTYAQTLVDNYLVPLNEGSRDLNDVSCGATYGAKLVRDMVNEASKSIVEKVWEK